MLASLALAQNPAALSAAQYSALQTYALRLRPGDDRCQQLTSFVQAHHIAAGTMLTCVGSLAVADSTGRTIGGHLLDGCRVYTTAEIVLGELPQLEFRREADATFGYWLPGAGGAGPHSETEKIAISQEKMSGG